MKVYIDDYVIRKRKIFIKGWAIGNTGGLNISKSGACELILYARVDINQLYSFSEETKSGFELTASLFKSSKINFHDQFEREVVHVNFLYFIKKRTNEIVDDGKRIGRFIIRVPHKLFKKIKEVGFLKAIVLGFKKIFKKRDTDEIDYNKWRIAHLPTKEELDEQRNHRFTYTPKISIIVPTYNTPVEYAEKMVKSVKEQTYENWELCIADGASTQEETLDYLKSLQDDKVKIKFLEDNFMISGNTNEALQLATGEYIALLDHDDCITNNALFEVVKALNIDNQIEFLYSDEDKVDQYGKVYSQPHFKPDFAIDNLRSYNYITHFAVIKKTLLDTVGKFDSNCDGAQDHDMFLRICDATNHIHHIPKVLYHWRIHEASTASNAGAKDYALHAGKHALEKHMKRNGIQGSVIAGKLPISYKIKYTIHGTPLVSILILNKDHVEDLRRCIHSIIKKTSYPNYEIIVVENNSETDEIFTYYKEIEDNVVIKICNQEFNYSALNNYGRQFCKGEYIILLNNDIEVISNEWMEELLMQCQRPEVGVVGAKLYYPNDTIQHAGVIIGISSVAGHSHKYFGKHEVGYMGRLQIVQDCSAVTAACMMVKASVYDEVCGLDETFKVAFNDVDFCLKVREKMYLIVFTPYAELYHYESLSRGAEDTPEKVARFNSEIKCFEKKWGLYRYDPYYNINLTLAKEDFSLKI